MRFHRTLFAILLISLAMAGAVSAQTISIVSGDGQLVRHSNPLISDMVVVVKNSAGQPLAGIVVTWTITTGGGTLLSTETTTDAKGLSKNKIIGAALFNETYKSGTITASIPGSAVVFTETSVGVNPATNDPFVPISLDFPTSREDVLIGPAGSTGTQPIVVRAASLVGTGVPHVLIELLPPANENGERIQDPDKPSIRCSGTTGFTDETGTANCLPVFGGKLGTNAQYDIVVGGGFREFPAYRFTVTKGEFATFRVPQNGGDGSGGNPGTRITLTAFAEDAAGNPVADVPVSWDVVSGSATISNPSTASNSSGLVTATATLGGTPGTVKVRVRNVTADPTKQKEFQFTLSVNLVVSGISKVSGDNQDAVVNTSYTQPLIVQVSTPQGPVSGVQVQFVANPSGAVSFPNGPTATTDGQGRASINVTAGPTERTATVIASVASLTTSFNLTIRASGPDVRLSSFFNGAGGQPGGVSPTAIVSIYGKGIATGLQGCVSGNQIIGPLPILLANVTVLFAVPSTTYQAYGPLYSVCNVSGQEWVSAQVPADLPVGTVSVTVQAGAGRTTVANVPVTPVSPGIFETVMSDGVKRAVLLHPDGSYVQLESKARPGEILRAFVTGLGRPITAAGFRAGTNQGGIPGTDASPTQDIVVGVANEGVVPTSVVYAPYLIGVYVVTFQVQANPPIRGDNVPFAVAARINDVLQFGNPSKIPLQ